MDGLDVLQLRCAAHHVMPHAHSHAAAGSHLQVLGEMRIHLAVYQKEDDAIVTASRMKTIAVRRNTKLSVRFIGRLRKTYSRCRRSF